MKRFLLLAIVSLSIGQMSLASDEWLLDPSELEEMGLPVWVDLSALCSKYCTQEGHPGASKEALACVDKCISRERPLSATEMKKIGSTRLAELITPCSMSCTKEGHPGASKEALACVDKCIRRCAIEEGRL